MFTYLALRCVDEGRYAFFLQQVADELHLSPRQVRYALEKLEEAGLCHHSSQRRGGVIVTIRGAIDSPSEQGECPSEAPNFVTNRVTYSDEKKTVSQSIDADSCGLAPTERENLSHKSTLNHRRESKSLDKPKGRSKTPSPIPPISPLPSSPQTVEDEMPEVLEGKYYLSRKEAMQVVYTITRSTAVREAAAEWIAMRYAKRRGDHQLTRKAVVNAFDKLRKLGYTTESQAVACFEQSIERQWDGLFEVGK